MADNYEAQVEAELAYLKLQESAAEQSQRATDRIALCTFLATHPEFKEFYCLLKQVETGGRY